MKRTITNKEMVKQARISRIAKWLYRQSGRLPAHWPISKPAINYTINTPLVQRGVREVKLLDQAADIVTPRLNRATRTVMDMPFPTMGVAEVLAPLNYLPATYAQTIMRSPRLYNAHSKAMRIMHGLGL